MKLALMTLTLASAAWAVPIIVGPIPMSGSGTYSWSYGGGPGEIFQFRRGPSWANAANVVKSRARIFTSRPSRLLIDGFAAQAQVFSSLCWSLACIPEPPGDRSCGRDRRRLVVSSLLRDWVSHPRLEQIAVVLPVLACVLGGFDKLQNWQRSCRRSWHTMAQTKTVLDPQVRQSRVRRPCRLLSSV